MSSPRASTTPEPQRTMHAAWISLVLTGLVIGSAFIAVYVGLQRAPEPSHLPIAVVGGRLASATESGLGDRIEVKQVESRAAGEDLVRSGRAVAAVSSLSPTTIQLDYAGARGLSESGAVRQLIGGLAAHADLTVQEQDIVPLVAFDNRGLSAFYVVFGVTLSSFVLAQGLTGVAARVRIRHRLYAMGGFAVVIGTVAAVIAGPIFGSLTAPFLPLAASLILLSAASAFTTKALGAWLGPAGIALSVLTLTTIGNATSGATIGYDLLPRWARAISAGLPPGAAVRAVNEFGYFGGESAASSLLVLAIWFVAGLALVLLRQYRAELVDQRRSGTAGSTAPTTSDRGAEEISVGPR